MTSRIYRVTHEFPSEKDVLSAKDHLVRAPNPAQAIGHVVKGAVRAKVASQDDIAALVGKGVAIETVGE